eukprot:TRINITY_DN888_c0_g1_i2.p1 TRINITY_DN888_c0_g1~~TRINITY_DN888_c0_g1_i2.p1  ORF type:complete len:364 (+),score=82.67 TRINITY_DN888_c0_g1_i2:702-1793(+)
MAGKQLALALVGPGLIGKTFINQLHNQSNNLNVKLYGVANSKKMLIDENGIELSNWEDRFLNGDTQAISLDEMSSMLQNQVKQLSESEDEKKRAIGVMVDCTANNSVSDNYATWLKKGLNVVTPNKRLHSGDLARYKEVQTIVKQNGDAKYLYEGVVGAGLPVMDTLKRLVKSGDKIYKIEGVFSGTMSYIFNTMSKQISFSQVVTLAKQQGFTEPDPREDLDGQDVARKVVALGRECGLDISLSDIQVQSLVSEKVASATTPEQVLEFIKEDDQSMEKKRQKAESEGGVLRYVGILDVQNQKGMVKIEQYPLNNALGGLKGSENIVMIRSERYDEVGMTIMGPGAGAEVTAAAVFGDVLSLL